MEQVLKFMLENKEDQYADFSAKLVPTVGRERFLGLRTPILKSYAKELLKTGQYKEFLAELPHTYYDENQLHAFIISGIKSFDECMRELEKFLPYMDNWATCDQTSPAVFKKRKKDILPYIDKWLSSNETYTIRFAIDMLMKFFLDEDFREDYMERTAAIQSDEYYVNMEIAWYMATALAKQWDAAIKIVEQGGMNKWVHNKTIQKARESYRITEEQKAYLKSLKK